MAKIDITTTATIRPGLLERTYSSFNENLFGRLPHDYRVIINIDPVGNMKYGPEAVIKVAQSFFNNVTFNVTESGNFAKAWRWCWNQVDADYVFHLEEDWLLLRPVNINHMIKILNTNKSLATLRMMKFDVPTNMKFFRSKYRRAKGFLLAEDRAVSFGGNPQLIKGEFVKQARIHMTDNRNPEKQFRNDGSPLWAEVVSKWDYGVYATKPGEKQLVRDIGRNWRSKAGYEKKGGAGFLEWRKK